MNKRKRKEENHFTKLTIVLKIKKKSQGSYCGHNSQPCW